MQLPIPVENHPSVIDLLDSANPQSVYNLVSTQIQTAITNAREASPELFLEDEADLKAVLRSRNQEPTPTDHRIRINFWEEYEKTHAAGRRSMSIEAIHAGVCSRQYFQSKYLSHPSKVAWMLCPPANYLTATKEALLYGIDQLREILSYPMKENGKFNTRIMEIKLKIVDLLDKRILGAIPQKILNLHASADRLPSNKAVNGVAAEAEMRAITKRIKELEARDRTRERSLKDAEITEAEETKTQVLE